MLKTNIFQFITLEKEIKLYRLKNIKKIFYSKYNILEFIII